MGLNDNWILVEPVGPSEITAKFSGDGVSGSAGCNQYSGRVEIGGPLGPNQVDISNIATTKMACEPAIMKREQEYLTTLEQVNNFTIQKDTLTFHINKAGPLLTFVRGT